MISDPTTSALSAARYALAGQFDPTPDSVRAGDFEAWPVSVQVAFVRAFAGGASSASILVGRRDEPKVIATLSAGGGDVAITQAPAAIDARPFELSVATFMDWPNEAQLFYARANGAGVPTAVTIGPAGATVTATVTRDALGNAAGVSVASDVDAALFDKPPSGLSAAAFFALLPSEQGAYVRRLGRIDPDDATRTPRLAIAGAGADDTPILLDDNGRRFAVVVPAGTYPGFATPLTGQDSAVAGADFANWPREVRRAYVEAQPGDQPKTVVLAGGDDIAFIGAPGGDVDTVAVPHGFNGRPRADAFLEWPPAAQIAYARRHAENPANPHPLVLAGQNGQTLTVTLAPAGLALSAAPMPGLAPRDVDLDLVQLWPSAAQVAYLAARGSLTPRSVVLGANEGLLTLGAGGVPEIDPFPARFGTTPASLAPATFLGWSPAFRALYLERNGMNSGSTRSVSIGDPSALTVSAAVSGGVTGALQLTSDSLRIPASRAMELKLADPTENIYGSGGQNLDPNRASAEAVFPLLTSLNAADFPDAPAGTVDTKAIQDQSTKAPSDLAVQQFQGWNGATQRAYVLARASVTSVPIKNPDPLNPAPVGVIILRRLEIGSGDAKITVFCTGEPPGAVYTAERITQADALRMSSQDQYALAGLLTREQFGQWHTAAQIAYLKRSGDGAKGYNATIGTGAASVTAFVSADGTKVYRVEDLQKTDIGKMPSADQAVLADLDAFKKAGGKRDALGLTLTQAAAQLLVHSLRISIDPSKKLTNDTAIPKTLKGGQTDMPPEDRAVFVGELDILTARIAKGSAYSASDLTAQIQEVQDRFERANCFAASVHGPDKNVTMYGWAGLESGYKTFMAQERQLLSLAQNRQSLAEQTASGKLDVPNLVYLFQLSSNLAGEAKIRADTEEISQTNELLKIYGKAQNKINEVLKLFDPKNTAQQLSLDNVRDSTKTADDPLTKEDIAIKTYFTSAKPGSPIERLINLTRPTSGFGAATAGNWTIYNQQLTDHVSLLNQESQVKMNAVNSQTKAKDRNFDLANNALSKMNEIVQKIAGT